MPEPAETPQTPPKVGGPGRAPAKSARSRAQPARQPVSVIMQARVEGRFAKTLLDEDAVVLGLDGPSALVREGLRLVHERAREAAMVAAYDDFYDNQPAPLPAGVAPDAADD